MLESLHYICRTFGTLLKLGTLSVSWISLQHFETPRICRITSKTIDFWTVPTISCRFCKSCWSRNATAILSGEWGERVDPFSPFAWHNVEVLEVLPSKRLLLYTLITQRWSCYECCRELNDFSPPILAHLSHHTITEADLRAVVWKIALSTFSVFFHASFPSCPQEGPPARWGYNCRIGSRRAPRFLFSLPPGFFRFVSDDVLLRFFYDFSFDLVTVLLTFKRFRVLHWSGSFLPRVVLVQIPWANGWLDRLLYVARFKARGKIGACCRMGSLWK